MKFLVTMIGNQTMPPEVAPALMEAMAEWASWARKSGKFDMLQAYAGQPGGMAVINVNSLEELDELVAGCPVAPFSQVQTIPLCDIDKALTHAREQFRKMSNLRR